jgi:hypothetical protein
MDGLWLQNTDFIEYSLKNDTFFIVFDGVIDIVLEFLNLKRVTSI